MRIVNPSFGLPDSADGQTETRAVDWHQDPIVLFSNSKPNARELLEGVRQRIGAFRPTDNVDFICKDSPAQPAPPEMIDDLTRRYRAAILALAD